MVVIAKELGQTVVALMVVLEWSLFFRHFFVIRIGFSLLIQNFHMLLGQVSA
jgi:hypothetical protein